MLFKIYFKLLLRV